MKVIALTRLLSATFLALCIGIPTYAATNSATSLTTDLEKLDEAGRKYFIAPVGETNVGLLARFGSKDTSSTYMGSEDKPSGELEYRIYDSTGAVKATVPIHPAKEGEKMHYPTFATDQSGNAFIFWVSKEHLFCQKVSPKGLVIFDPRRVGSDTDDVLIDGPFIASIYKDKIIGMVQTYVRPEASTAPSSVRLVLDSNLRIISNREYDYILIESGDSIVVDDLGYSYLVYHDCGTEDRLGQAVISYTKYDPSGEIKEHKEIARLDVRFVPFTPPHGITLDPQGQLHIYYAQPIKATARSKETGWKPQHVEIKCDPPTKEPRRPVILSALFADLITVQSDGNINKTKRPLVKLGPYGRRSIRQ